MSDRLIDALPTIPTVRGGIRYVRGGIRYGEVPPGVPSTLPAFPSPLERRLHALRWQLPPERHPGQDCPTAGCRCCCTCSDPDDDED